MTPFPVDPRLRREGSRKWMRIALALESLSPKKKKKYHRQQKFHQIVFELVLCNFFFLNLTCSCASFPFPWNLCLLSAQ
ncbi:uncharacterized protein CTRU02_203533 [Colletotrichum truncatum]|uniref:Uncharacterized protein n=1 Tax=Colletotrichum truncatum TaxID=5467 RepID=A0ACC3Z9U5_COLTU